MKPRSTWIVCALSGALVAVSIAARLPERRFGSRHYSSLNISAAKRGSSMLVVLAKPTTVRPVARSIAARKVAWIACWYWLRTWSTVSCFP